MSILKPDIFMRDVSLADHIYRLSDSKVEVSPEEVANLIVKYFFCYIEGRGYTEAHGEKEINRAFQRFGDFGGPKNIQYSSREEDIFVRSGYPLGMIADVSSTIALFMEIATRQVDNILGNKEYHGLDIGTGTGILLLAQFIQAYRSKLIPNPEKNIGVEISTNTVQFSSEIAEKLGFGRIVQADASTKESYYSLPDRFHFISHENLTSPGKTFGSGGNREPFFEALFALLETGKISYSLFFPQRVKIGGNILSDEVVVDLGNEQQLRDFLSLYERFEKLKLNASSRLYPLSIEIGGKMIYLDEVGKHYEDEVIGIVNQVTANRRW